MSTYTLPTDPIFISYSHDSEEHMRWVWKLAINLRRQGLKVIFDQDANPEPEKPDESIKTMLEFYRIHQRAAGIIPTDIFRSSVELPEDRELNAQEYSNLSSRFWSNPALWEDLVALKQG